MKKKFGMCLTLVFVFLLTQINNFAFAQSITQIGSFITCGPSNPSNPLCNGSNDGTPCTCQGSPGQGTCTYIPLEGGAVHVCVIGIAPTSTAPMPTSTPSNQCCKFQCTCPNGSYGGSILAGNNPCPPLPCYEDCTCTGSVGPCQY